MTIKELKKELDAFEDDDQVLVSIPLKILDDGYVEESEDKEFNIFYRVESNTVVLVHHD